MFYKIGDTPDIHSDYTRFISCLPVGNYKFNTIQKLL